MELIPTETIDLRWKDLENIDLDEIPNLIDMLGKNQPFILTYLMAIGSEVLNHQEREVLLFLGVMAWNIVKPYISTNPREITTDELIEKETKNIAMLEYLSDEPDADFFLTVKKLIGTFHQSHLLMYILDRLMDELGDDTDSIYDNNIGMILIYLKGMIDCLDTAF